MIIYILGVLCSIKEAEKINKIYVVSMVRRDKSLQNELKTNRVIVLK